MMTVTFPSPPPPTLQKQSLLPLGLVIDVVIEHPGVSVGLNQGSYLAKDEEDDEENNSGNVDHALISKLTSLVIHW